MRTTPFFFLCLFFFTASVTFALERKPWLGSRLETSKEMSNKALRVSEVSGGTAAALGLQMDDLILACNKIPIHDMQAFLKQFDGFTDKQAIEMRIKRGNKEIRLKGKIAARPFETDDKSEVIYEEAPYKNGTLRVIINKPKSTGKMPAMLFVPGYTCRSIDNLDPESPYKRIVKAFSDNGYLSMRIEKSGLGDSYGTPPCETCDLHDEVENFAAGLRKLKSLPYVDTNKIILFGHSMGGIVAPAVAAANPVAGVIVYGTLSTSWFEYILQMTRLQNKLGGMSTLQAEVSTKEGYEAAYRFYVRKEKLSQMASDTALLRLLKQQWEYDGNTRIYTRNAEYWRQIQDYPILENWQKIKAKVLVLFGESDFQAFSLYDHQNIVNTVNAAHPGSATLQSFPKTDHYMAASGNMQEAFDKFSSGKIKQLFKEFNPEVSDAVIRWSNSLCASANTSQTSRAEWRKLNTDKYPGKQDDICFIDENRGWYVNGYGSIYRTRDGGNSWEKQLEKKGTFFRCIAFIDSLRGFAGTVGTDYFPNVSDTIPLYATGDGGKTWNPVSYKGPYVKGLCAIDMVKEQYINHGNIAFRYHLYAVGRVGSPANMMVSHDNGETWESWPVTSGKMLFDIKMFNKENGIACSASSENMEESNALILSTSDGGKTWKQVYQSKRPFECTWKASFPSRETGYVTIQSYHPDTTVKEQRIVKTTDGGKTWTEHHLVTDAKAREFGIGFLDDKHGFVGTVNSGYETTDGGIRWNPIDLGRACNKIRIYKNADGKQYGYSIGVNVYKYISSP
jgi:photosystem II stability/assembly factor-like uncharacterized protein/pimeloyl-ACP methyl ester carboxylesterase